MTDNITTPNPNAWERIASGYEAKRTGFQKTTGNQSEASISVEKPSDNDRHTVKNGFKGLAGLGGTFTTVITLGIPYAATRVAMNGGKCFDDPFVSFGKGVANFVNRNDSDCLAAKKMFTSWGNAIADCFRDKKEASVTVEPSEKPKEKQWTVGTYKEQSGKIAQIAQEKKSEIAASTTEPPVTEEITTQRQSKVKGKRLHKPTAIVARISNIVGEKKTSAVEKKERSPEEIAHKLDQAVNTMLALDNKITQYDQMENFLLNNKSTRGNIITFANRFDLDHEDPQVVNFLNIPQPNDNDFDEMRNAISDKRVEAMGEKAKCRKEISELGGDPSTLIEQARKKML